jgi:pimeloyl-ACP methyl ester carboxylesterase
MQVDRLRVLFGDSDWLHTKNARAVVDELKVSGRFPNLEIDVLEKAGHHLYYDNHLAFNEAVIKSVPRK